MTWSLWALVAVVYLLLSLARRAALRRAIREARAVGPRFLGRISTSLAQLAANAAGVRIASVDGDGLNADRSRRFMYVWHPHGFVSYVPTMMMGGMARDGFPHDRQWFGTCAPFLFNIPLLGEHITVSNARPVDRRSLESILGRGGTVAIQPGGIKEQAATRHDQEQAFFPKKLGFVRLAIKHGTPLMPLYLFGENQLYKRIDGMEWLTRIIYRLTGMTLPIVTAKWHLPQAGMLPIATNVHIRYGNPVDVGEPEPEPSDARVEEVFGRYLEELQHVFDANAGECLPPAVAKRGLKVVRL
jgi:1-acyl-sn-glycerol-3-phosphate acyltransferase